MSSERWLNNIFFISSAHTNKYPVQFSRIMCRELVFYGQLILTRGRTKLALSPENHHCLADRIFALFVSEGVVNIQEGKEEKYPTIFLVRSKEAKKKGNLLP